MTLPLGIAFAPVAPETLAVNVTLAPGCTWVAEAVRVVELEALLTVIDKVLIADETED